MPDSTHYVIYREQTVAIPKYGPDLPADHHEALVKVAEFDTDTPEWRVLEEWARENEVDAGRYWVRLQSYGGITVFDLYVVGVRTEYVANKVRQQAPKPKDGEEISDTAPVS